MKQVVLPTNGNCRIGVYSHSKAEYDVDFEESPYMWRCIPGKSLRLCRRCGLPAKCGLPVVWGYSIKVSPSGYACRDGIFVRAPTGKAIIPSTSTGWNQEIMPTGFSLEKCNEFASQRALGDTFGYVPKGTAALFQHTQDDVRQWQSHIDASTSRMRYYLDETRSDLQHLPAQPVAIAAKAKLWPRLAAAKIQVCTIVVSELLRSSFVDRSPYTYTHLPFSLAACDESASWATTIGRFKVLEMDEVAALGLNDHTMRVVCACSTSANAAERSTLRRATMDFKHPRKTNPKSHSRPLGPRGFFLGD